MRTIKVISESTIYTAEYSIAKTQETGVLEFTLKTDGLMQPQHHKVDVELGDQITDVIFQTVIDKTSDMQADIVGVMVEEDLLPYFIPRYNDEYEVYPL